MKKIIYSLLFACAILTFYSCEYDNYDEPSEGFSGKVIDSTTGENFIMSSRGLELRMYETSWSSTPSPRSINVKDDGTFNNNRLFAGTYKVIPTNGAFWPTDTMDVELKGGHTVQDFTVTPYLKLTIINYELKGTTLVISGKIDAPIVEGLPKIIDIQPFVAITKFVGDANISQYSDNNKVQINKNFEDGVKDEIFTMRIPDLKMERTFYVRLGARVDDSFKKHNFSEIIQIDVPFVEVDPNAIPDNYFKNADFPFARATWDEDRWGTLTEWITNDAMRSRGDGQYGGYDGGYGDYQGGLNSSFGFERWGDGETPIVNGKIYQTLTMPAGTYKLTLSIGGDNPQRDNNGSDLRFIVAATGNELPDVETIDSALGSATFAGLGRDESTSFEFTLDSETKVTAGVVASFTSTEQNVRISNIKLEKLD